MIGFFAILPFFSYSEAGADNSKKDRGFLMPAEQSWTIYESLINNYSC
jgi:hypothetical protein